MTGQQLNRHDKREARQQQLALMQLGTRNGKSPSVIWP